MPIFDPAIFDPAIFDTEDSEAPSTPTGAFHLWRNDTDVTPQSEWDATWSEATGPVCEATVTVQNREGVPELDFHVPVFGTRDIIRMTYGSGDETDWVLYEGELITADLDLPVGFPWRRWRLSCTDWNTVPDLRLINVPDGQNWGTRPGGDADLASSDPNGPQAVDPEAVPSATDKTTIQGWYDFKVRAPDGGSFETDTYVGEYVPNLVLNDAATGEPNYIPSRGSVKAAIAGLSALAAMPVSDWIDPDRKVHHQSFDVTDETAVGAPVEITDVRAEWDGVSKIGGRGLHIVPDFGGSIEEAYVDGNVTDFVALASGDPDVGLFSTRYLMAGTGWGHSTMSYSAHSQTKRQGIVSGQSVTKTQRDALADAYTAYALRPRYRGQITVGGRDDEGNGLPIVVGFRAGQWLKITDERLPGDIIGGPGVLEAEGGDGFADLSWAATGPTSSAWPIQAIRGSLAAGRGGPADPTHPGILQYTLEFGNAPVGQFSAVLAQHDRKQLEAAAKPKPAPKHVIYFQTLNPKPESTQTLTSQAKGNDDLPVKVKGMPVTWEFVSVTDHLGADISGNGETLDPTDTVTDANGQSTTTFTAGTETDAYYQIEAWSPYET